jgi:quinol-cytochrome oxidoreductase complex cytochrome b subunit
MLLSLLFPFRKTYTVLRLHDRWWHRLAVSIFVLTVLGLSLAFGGARVSDDIDAKDHKLNAVTTTFVNEEAALDNSANSRAMTYQLSIRYEQTTHQLRREFDENLAEDYGWTFGFCLSLSYILQLIYRLAVYVVFGNKAHA